MSDWKGWIGLPPEDISLITGLPILQQAKSINDSIVKECMKPLYKSDKDSQLQYESNIAKIKEISELLNDLMFKLTLHANSLNTSEKVKSYSMEDRVERSLLKQKVIELLEDLKV